MSSFATALLHHQPAKAQHRHIQIFRLGDDQSTIAMYGNATVPRELLFSVAASGRRRTFGELANVTAEAIVADDLGMDDAPDPIAVFRVRLFSEWLPAFCDDPERGYGMRGFREASIRVGPIDAANFLRAIDGGLVKDIGGGRYRCAKSKALEQLFWEHEKHISPRPVTLWMEPVIGIATLARFHYDLSWPEHRLGMQTKDGAFDLAAYGGGDVPDLIVACEIKKSRLEVDQLVADLHYHSRCQLEAPISGRRRHINSFRKWVALRRDCPPFLWVVGPERYECAFELVHSHDTATLTPVGVARIMFES